MKARIILLLALFTLGLFSSCEKETATELVSEPTMEQQLKPQGWALVEDSQFAEFDEEKINQSKTDISPRSGMTMEEDAEYFVDIENRKVYIRKGLPVENDDLMSPPEFDGIPKDFDLKTYNNTM